MWNKQCNEVNFSFISWFNKDLFWYLIILMPEASIIDPNKLIQRVFLKCASWVQMAQSSITLYNVYVKSFKFLKRIDFLKKYFHLSNLFCHFLNQKQNIYCKLIRMYAFHSIHLSEMLIFMFIQLQYHNMYWNICFTVTFCLPMKKKTLFFLFIL